MSGGRELLTHSRMAGFKTCRRRDYIEYELGWRTERDAAALRTGGNIHLGLDLRAKGKTLEETIATVRANYADPPEWIAVDEWALECEIVCRMLAGYYWRWQSDEIEVVATEQQFNDMPICNPDTGKSTPIFKLAGKIDKIVRLGDGRTAVMEHKTTGDSIAPDSDFWRRLRLDQQISLYMLAARWLGYHADTMLYDTIHKPGMKPYPATLPEKLKRKKDGTLYANCRLEAEPLHEYGERLTADIGERPDFYYARREIPRLESDLDDFQAELWQIQRDIREAQKAGRHFRNTAACLHPYRCPHLDICANLNPDDGPPEGYRALEFVHPELEETNDNNNSATNEHADSAAAETISAVE